MIDIYIDDIGEGFPLVLVHGYLGSTEIWTFQKDFFSDREHEPDAFWADMTKFNLLSYEN